MYSYRQVSRMWRSMYLPPLAMLGGIVLIGLLPLHHAVGLSDYQLVFFIFIFMIMAQAALLVMARRRIGIVRRQRYLVCLECGYSVFQRDVGRAQCAECGHPVPRRLRRVWLDLAAVIYTCGGANSMITRRRRARRRTYRIYRGYRDGTLRPGRAGPAR